MNFILKCLALVFSAASAWAGSALFPEDGTGRVGRWYYSQESSYIMNRPGVLESMQSVAREHNFTLYDVGQYYTWMQDLLLFDVNGDFVAQAKYPFQFWYFGSDDLFRGLTMGVFSEDGGLNRVSEIEASRWTNVARTMESTLVEGGELITGIRKNGEPYAIIDRLALSRAQVYYNREKKKNYSESKVHELVAKDLGVSPKNLIPLKAPQHLDLFMLAMPGEKILIQDHRKVAPLIDELIAKGEVPITEVARLNTIADSHRTENLKEVMHYNDLYDDMAKTLELSGFDVERIAGDFSGLIPWGEKLTEKYINFFNSFHGTDERGVHWMVTSPAGGISSLESYWRELLKGVRVHFVGHYTSGMGMDCTGAMAPSPIDPKDK